MKLNSTVAAVYDRRWILGLLLLSTPLLAQTNAALVTTNAAAATDGAKIDPFSDPLIKQVQARHDKAVAGDKNEAKALTADLEKWVEQQPTNYLLQAYLGSIYTVDSRDSWWGPTKLDDLKKGGRWLDGAVASAPDNPAVRFIRAIDYFELPSLFGKHQTARDDFQILLKQVTGETKTSYVLNTDTQQAICLYAGKSFYQLSQYPQAKDAWAHGYKLAPNSDLGKKIGDELMKMK